MTLILTSSARSVIGQPDGTGGGAIPHAGSERSAEEAHRRRPQWPHEGPERVQRHRGQRGDQTGAFRSNSH